MNYQLILDYRSYIGRIKENLLIELVRFNDIINFKDHFANLSSQLVLLLLRVESFINSLSFHVIGTRSKAVDS